MGNFNKGRAGGGGKKFGGPSFGGDGGRGDRGGFGGGRDTNRPQMMHKATCSDCGRGCEVPFRPSGDKPVYCSDCFQRKNDGPVRSDSRDGGSRSYEQRDTRPRYENNPRPQQYGNAQRPQVVAIDYKAQFEQLHAKLDKILRALPTTALESKEVEQKSTKWERPEKKVVDTVELKKSITTAMADIPTKKPVEKSKSVKKKPAAKTAAKKVASKKVAAAATKKVASKKVAAKKK